MVAKLTRTQTDIRHLPWLYGAGRVCRRELRAGRNGWLVWTVALSVVVIGFMAVYPSIASMNQGITDFMRNLPRGLSAAFNYNLLGLGDPAGYFGSEPYFVLALLTAFYAATGAASILAKEESDKTAEFLLTRPVGRSAVVTGKAMAMITFVVAMHVVLALAVWAALAWFAPNFHNPGLLLRLVLGSAIVALAFTGVALAVAAGLDDARRALTTGLGLAWGLYIVKLVGAIVPSLGWLGFVSPFGYADGADIVLGGGPAAWRIAVLLAVLVVGVVAAAWMYGRKDLRT